MSKLLNNHKIFIVYWAHGLAVWRPLDGTLHRVGSSDAFGVWSRTESLGKEGFNMREIPGSKSISQGR